jgi:F-type H+-transporting ATPase subunit b
VVLARFAWKPLLTLVEEREKGVRDAVDQAQRANAEAQELLLKHKDMVRGAAREREEILKRTLLDAETLKGDLEAKARVEGDRIVARAREQVQREKSAAVQELRKEVADLAVDAAARIVTSSMTPDAQRRLVEEFITSLPKTS